MLFQNLIYIGNLSTLLQLLILNKAYYLEIKIGLINESDQIFSTVPPFWNNYFSTGTQEEEKRGIPLYQTWHIVNNSITHYSTCHIKWYLILSYYHTKLHHPSPHVPSYPIILCPLLSYPILSYHIRSNYNISNHRHHYWKYLGSCLVPSRFY